MAAMPELGSKISLISKSDIRYEGQLYTVDPNECTIALANGEFSSALIIFATFVVVVVVVVAHSVCVSRQSASRRPLSPVVVFYVSVSLAHFACVV